MKLKKYLYIVIIAIAISSCTLAPTQLQSNRSPEAQLQPKVVMLDNKLEIATGQTVYVPVYSHIYYESKEKKFNLTATLSIRNTDLDNAIVIKNISYYDNNGKLVQKYLNNAIELPPLASTDFVVEESDSRGGIGANFIVEWIAQKRVSEPIIETVMIGTISNRGISFVSPGKIIKERNQK